jgi:Ca-activated chloride channel family protein
MTFAHPSVLTMLAVLVPLLVLLFWWSWRVRRRLIEQFVPRRLQQALTVGLSPRRARWRAVLWIAALAALLVALARPRYGAGAVEVRQRGLDIVLAVDTSRSMLAEDAGPGVSRLQRARLAALDLARLARNDRVGLVAFAGSAFLQCPLTVDDEAFRQSVEALDTGIIQQGGTAIGTAIHAALDAFGAEQENVRVLVLFTDGEEHESGALDAATRAAARGLRIYTVGVGTARGEIIQIRDDKGNTSYLKDAEGKVVKSALDESLLREIAAKSGGFYLPLQGARAMEELYRRGLEPLPRSDLGSRLFEQFTERFQWPLALALVLLVWETLVPERGRGQGRPREVRQAHPTLGGVAALLFVLFLGPGAFGSPRSALRDYEKGDYSASRAEYERLSRRYPKDARLRFNAGAAAYRAGDYDAAAQLFQGSLAADDLALQRDAYYNLGNARFRLGEASTEHKERMAAWEQAIRSYESALELDPQKPETRENLDYVRQRLEQLKQQQQQQQQQPDQQKKDPNEEKDDQQQSEQNQNQDSQPQDQQKKPGDDSTQSRDDSPDKDPQSPEEQEPKEEESKDSQKPKPEDPKKPEQRPQPQAGGPENKDQNPTPTGETPEEVNPGKMTPQQALRLLDAAKGEEKMMPLDKRRARSRTLKDW